MLNVKLTVLYHYYYTHLGSKVNTIFTCKMQNVYNYTLDKKDLSEYPLDFTIYISYTKYVIEDSNSIFLILWNIFPDRYTERS